MFRSRIVFMLLLAPMFTLLHKFRLLLLLCLLIFYGHPYVYVDSYVRLASCFTLIHIATVTVTPMLLLMFTEQIMRVFMLLPMFSFAPYLHVGSYFMFINMLMINNMFHS